MHLNTKGDMVARKALLPVLLLVFTLWASPAPGFPAVEVYKDTAGSVVLIVAQSGRGSSMLGAGSIVSRPGIVATNAHVVIDGATGRPYRDIWVFLKPRVVRGSLGEDLSDRHEAEVVAYDTALDLAVLKAHGVPERIGPLELADPGEIMVGEEVVAIGHPEQGGLWTLTYGRISGQISDQGDTRGKDVFQTDTSLNRGNSGGPLLDSRGYIVGVNTNIARVGAEGVAITGVNFAVKSSVLRRWLASNGISLSYGRQPLKAGAEYLETAPEPPETEAAPEGTEMKEAPELANEPAIAEPTPKEPEAKAVEALKPEPKAEALKEPAPNEQDRMLTPKRPYSMDDLFRKVEEEMEDLMDEMRMKIRK